MVNLNGQSDRECSQRTLMATELSEPEIDAPEMHKPAILRELPEVLRHASRLTPFRVLSNAIWVPLFLPLRYH